MATAKSKKTTRILEPVNDDRPFKWKVPGKGKVLYLSTDDVSCLAEQILYQAMLPSKTVSTDEKYDPLTGKVIEATRTTTTEPGSWQAAAAWLTIEALKGR